MFTEGEQFGPFHIRLEIAYRSQKPTDWEQFCQQESRSRRGQIHRALADLYKLSGDELKAAEHQEGWLRTASGEEVFKFVESRIENLTGTNPATYAEAVALMERALEMGVDEGRQPRIHRILGEIYLRCGDNIKALKHLENAPEADLVKSVQSLIEKLTGPNIATYAEVIAAMERRLELGMDEKYRPRIHRTLGEIYLRCDDNTKALAHLETALSLNPKIGVQKLVKRLKLEKQTRESLTT